MIAQKALVAETLIGMLVGFIAHRKPWENGALGIPECDRVHTFFVPRPLDLAFCDREGRVLQIVESLAPNRVSPRVRGSWLVWETEAGGLTSGVAVGDILALEFAGG